MNLTGLVGNAHLHDRLRGPLAHAYILSGPEGTDKRGLAEIMARSLVCTGPGDRPCNTCPACEKALKGFHPDIQVTGRETERGKEKTEIVVAQVRQITTDAYTLPNEAEHKVYIVEDADTMNASAQNAFLKMLEEPPGFVTFLLLAENPLALLPTVRSRCIHLQLVPEAEGLTGDQTELVREFMAALPAGGLTLLEFCVGLEKADRPALTAFVDACHAALTEALKTGGAGADRARLMTAVELFDSLRDDLRFNVSAGHISGKIAATLA